MRHCGVKSRAGCGVGLRRADTAYIVPEDLVAEVAAGVQTTTEVVQAVLKVGIVRGSRPPVAVRRIAERAIVVVSASNCEI